MAEITVYDFIGLKNALTDNTSTVIYLGGSITFSSGGIVVPKTKGDIVIDGGGYTVTDWNSAAATDTIHFLSTAGPAVTITLQNVIWSGKNYFGIIHAYDSSNNSNITVILKNVQYTGPQPIHHRYGMVRIINSAFRLEVNGATYISQPQEFAEVNRLRMEGTITVNKQTTGYSVIWFTYGGASFTVEEDAVFKVEAPNTYMFYADNSTLPVMTFSENSITDISTGLGLYYSTSPTIHMASSFTIKNGASFKHIQSMRNGSVPSFKCRNSFVMEEGSLLHLFMPYSGTSPLMYFGATATISFHNPKSIILYNNGGNVFRFNAGSSSSPNKIDIEAELINRWTTATTPLSVAGGFDDTPTRVFAKADGSNITATINTTTNTITLLDSNVLSGDQGDPMNNTTFNIFQTQVLSMGNLMINLNEICDVSTAITGVTEPLANIKAMYNSLTITGTAGVEGEIDLTVSTPIPIGTMVDFASNWNFLTKHITLKTVGSLRITYLPDLEFNCFAVPYRRNIVKRKDLDWYLEVTDTRTNGADWYLYASLPNPMSSGSGTLDDALIFNANSSSEIMSTTPILIRKGMAPPVVTRITWTELEGFLLKVDPDFFYNEGHYVAAITWELRGTLR